MNAPPDVQRLLRNLHMLRDLVGRILEQEKLEESAGERLTFPQLNVLKMVGARAPAGPGERRKAWRIGEIAQHLEVSFPAASQAVRRLAREGWLEVKRDPVDSRQLMVSLTPRARAVVRRYEARKEHFMEELLSGSASTAARRWNRALEAIIGRFLETSDALPCLRCGVYPVGSCIAIQHGVICPVRGRS